MIYQTGGTIKTHQEGVCIHCHQHIKQKPDTKEWIHSTGRDWCRSTQGMTHAKPINNGVVIPYFEYIDD